MAKRAAKSISLTASKAKPKKRMAKSMDQKYLGMEPEWINVDTMTESEFQSYKSHAYTWYNYFNTVKDLRKSVIVWMTKQNYNKTDIAAVKHVSDSELGMAVCSNATMLLGGMPDAHSGWLRDKLAGFIEHGKGKVAEKKKSVKKAAYAPSIQERMKDKLDDHLGEIEGMVDEFILNGNADHGLFAWLKNRSVAQQHGKTIAAFYMPIVAEYTELATKDCDEQLVEGYGELSKADIKKHIKFYQSLVDDADSYTETKKATRKTKKAKPKSNERIVAKVKFLKESTLLKVVSVNPADIIGATELWVYNIKKRKLGRYFAGGDGYNNNEGLSIKGTTIIGYDEKTSVQKTLRKPEEQLKAFNKAGKVVLRKFLDDIRAVDTKMNGRLNTDTLLLKVVK